MRTAGRAAWRYGSPGADRPAAGRHAAHDGLLLGDGDPHVEPGAAVRGHALGRQGLQQRGAPGRVDRGRGLRAAVPRRDRQERRRDALEVQAHPAAAQPLATRDPRDRDRVAGEQREPRSGPSVLPTDRSTAQRSRPVARLTQGAPATSTAWSSSTTRTSAAQSQHRTQLRCALLGQRRPGRVLRARAEHHRTRAALHRGLERPREQTLVVHGDRHGREPHRAREVDHAHVARVLDRDRVAGSQVRAEHPLHPVHRARHHTEVLRGDTVALQRGGRGCAQRRAGPRPRRSPPAAASRTPRRGLAAARGRGCPS